MSDAVVSVLGQACRLDELSVAEWSELVRQARRADLLGRIAGMAVHRPTAAGVPVGALAHLRAAEVQVRAQRESVLREVGFITRALAPLDIPIIFLKGAAYVLSDLPPARGRTFSDIDILVPQDSLPQVESALMLAGWRSTHSDPYDQRYYRVWMHELPPFQHLRRQSVLDVHHAILPRTARLKPDSGLLRAAAVTVAGRVQVLCPVDMVLHSMTHLFHNEEFSHGLRDLSDLDLLLRHFGRQPAFWPDLLDRAQQLTLTRPLFYGLRYTRQALGTPVPGEILRQSETGGPSTWLWPVMDGLWRRVLRSPHPHAADGWTSLARFLLYLRAHWLKMPPQLLLPHLLRKACRRVDRKA